MISRLARVLMVTATLAVWSGCSKDAPPEEPVVEPTTGGEIPGPETPTGSEPVATAETPLPPAPAESPWGKTQAEQCQRPERSPMSAAAAGPFGDGVQASRSGDTTSAAASFQKALSSDPRAYPALYNLGVIADRGGNEGEALDYYQRALSIQSDYEAAARGIATIQVRRGNAGAALSAVEPLARQFPTNLELQALYAEMLVEGKRYDAAWTAARAALKCDERHVPSLIALIKASFAQGREELGDSILAQALAVNPRNAELHFLQGERYKDQPGRLRDAMTEYEQAVRLRPDFAEARMALGVQLLGGGNYAGALSHFQEAQKLIPTLPAVHVNLGDAYRATKRWTDASAAYERALQLRSALPEAHYGLGLLHLTAAGQYPWLDELTALQKAQGEFQTYRREMGSRLKRDDQSAEYLKDLDRLIQRVQRRLERERNAASGGGGE